MSLLLRVFELPPTNNVLSAEEIRTKFGWGFDFTNDLILPDEIMVRLKLTGGPELLTNDDVYSLMFGLFGERVTGVTGRVQFKPAREGDSWYAYVYERESK